MVGKKLGTVWWKTMTNCSLLTDLATYDHRGLELTMTTLVRGWDLNHLPSNHISSLN